MTEPPLDAYRHAGAKGPPISTHAAPGNNTTLIVSVRIARSRARLWEPSMRVSRFQSMTVTNATTYTKTIRYQNQSATTQESVSRREKGASSSKSALLGSPRASTLLGTIDYAREGTC